MYVLAEHSLQSAESASNLRHLAGILVLWIYRQVRLLMDVQGNTGTTPQSATLFC